MMHNIHVKKKMNRWNNKFHLNFERTNEAHKFVIHHHPFNKFLYRYTCHYTYEMVKMHSYDILGVGMLWKPKKTRKFVKIRVEECFDKVLNEEFKKNLMCKMKNVITRWKCACVVVESHLANIITTTPNSYPPS